MITQQDLDEAIAECQGQRNPNASTCIKLAAFLTLQRELFAKKHEQEVPAYSFASAPPSEWTIGGTEFLDAVSGKDSQAVWKIMDELMESMKILQPRIYDSVMRKIQGL